MGEEFVSDDEFHETFEDITSTSGSDSADEGSGHDNRMRSTRVAPVTGVSRPPVWSPSAFESKFSVWKDDPSSINERRQRFFREKGLKSSRDEHGYAHVATLPAGVSSTGETASKKLRNSNEEPFAGSRVDEHVNPTCDKCGGERKGALAQGCAHVEGVQFENPGTTVEGASKSSPTENVCKSDSDNGPVQDNISHVDHEDKSPEKCSTNAEEGNSESGSKSAGARFTRSPGQKVCDCVDSVGSDCIYNLHEGCGERAEFLSIQGNMHKKMDSDSSSSLEDGSRVELGNQHRASSSQDKLFQSFDTDCGSDPGSPDVKNVDENIMEERLKIRDLDSGKEFLMKRFNRDGSLNLLREVATGKDLTMAEFEKTLGLFSPVTQELHRRERFADSQVSMKKPEPKTDGKSSFVTKRKSWLKRLRGALKTSSKDGLAKGGSARSVATYDSLDDTDASSVVGSLSGDGSPKRDSSFAGLDRNEFIKRVKLRQKSSRDLSDLHLSQEIIAHQGAIWTMKFSTDGRYLASAGQDRVVHVWEVVDHPLMADSDHWGGSEKGEGELERREGSFKCDNDGSVKGGQDRSMAKVDKEGSTKSGKGTPRKQKSSNQNKGPVPKLFWLSEKPMCSFRGHTEDILDLSWSRSQFLLSSSMDKTVRLWHISYDECLRIFPHNDYVTCAQFNPIDDRYFLSGSLDDKVRIWSIPDHHVVDWSDLQEMVTAVSYTPDGKRAIVGSYKGTCRFYNASGNKLQLEAHIDVRDENKKARGKKITGLHYMPGDPQKVLVTSNDSRVRVYDGLDLVAKYKGLRNVKSQISSSFSPNGDFIISASEDSRVLVWNSTNRDVSNKTYIYRRDKQLSCEEFTSRHVSVAITWPESSTRLNSSRSAYEPLGSVRGTNDSETSPPHEETVVVASKGSEEHSKCPSYCLGRSPLGIFGSGRKNSVAVADELTSTKQVEVGKHGHHQLDASPQVDISSKGSLQSPCDSPPHLHRRSSFFPECGPKGSATWPEEKLGSFNSGLSTGPNLPHSASICSNNTTTAHSGEATPPVDLVTVSPAWGLVIVTAGLGGEITTFQNYGFPVRL
ncbi:hypothetical protein KC19_N027300 [Ceratodon purpureus]|nr:hypothetical protein KC19_N027300 [Ceratodon purpureus]